MAQRRMFSKRITNSGRFLTMSPSAQALYFHLGMEADDDGVVEAHSIIKITDSKPDDYNLLLAKKFIYPLNDDLVVVILDWREHNLIRPDRKIDSIYKDLLAEKLPNLNLIEPRPRADREMGRPMDNQMSAQVRLGKVRLIGSADAEEASDSEVVLVDEDGNSITPKKKKDPQERKDLYWMFSLFKEINPAWESWVQIPTQRGAGMRLLKSKGKDKIQRAIELADEIKDEPYAPQIKSPYELEQKWSKLKSFLEKND